MDIVSFDPGADDAHDDIAAYAAIASAVDAADAEHQRPSTPSKVAGHLVHGWDGEPATPYLVRIAGEVVAAGRVATSDRDNLDAAWLTVNVHPAHRRRGIGTLLLEHLVEEARRRGRTSIGSEAWDTPAMRAFAERHGYEVKYAGVQRTQHLAEVDHAALRALCSDAAPLAVDYALERWPVPTPEERLDALATMAAAINDAPRDDLEREDEVVDADRMRAYEVATAARGERLYRLVARHVPSGELAAQTVVCVEAERPQYGNQHDTSVTRAHRGHRLGLLLKAEMLAWLAEAEPQLETIETWNAASNDHMIAVNEVLGYRVTGREIAVQRRY